MKLSVVEAGGLHEILQDLAVDIEKLAVYVEEAQHPELRQLIQEKLRSSEQDYQELREMVDWGSLFPNAEHGWAEGTRMRIAGGAQSGPHPLQPRPSGRFSDRAIATDMLSASKSMAVRDIWTATEMGHQSLRRTLAELSRRELDFSFKVYKFMESQGWYPQYKVGENPERWLLESHRMAQDVHGAQWQA